MDAEYVSLHKGRQLCGLSYHGILVAALRGQVKALVLPGFSPRFHAGDLERLKYNPLAQPRERIGA
jgi:hypothetical protein